MEKEGIETEKDDTYICWKCKSIVMKMEKQSRLMRVVIRSAIICIESFDRFTPVFSLSGNNSSLTPIPFLPLKIRVFLRNDSLPTSRMEIRWFLYFSRLKMDLFFFHLEIDQIKIDFLIENFTVKRGRICKSFKKN